MAEIERCLHEAPDALRRLGALASFVSEDAERLFQRLRLSNAEHQRLLSMSEGWWRIERGMQARGARALIYQIGPASYADRVLLAWSRSRDATDDVSWRELARFPQTWTAPKFPLAAADLIAQGVAKGPALGVALRKAEEAWIGADFPAERSEIAQIARMAAKGLS
jgi:poly(A) polymerase